MLPKNWEACCKNQDKKDKSGQFVYIGVQTAFQVACLVIMDNVDLCQFINHREHLWQHGNGCCLICGVTNRFDGVACGPRVIPVVKTSCNVLTIAFFC